MNWQDILQNLNGGVVAAATAGLVWFTARLVSETRKLNEHQSRTFVSVSLEPSRRGSTAYDQVVRNEGGRTAFNVEIQTDPAYGEYRETMPTKRISVLPPGSEHRSAGALSDELAGKSITFSVSWTLEPQSTERTTVKFPIELGHRDRSAFNVKDLHDVAIELEKIRILLEREKQRASEGQY